MATAPAPCSGSTSTQGGTAARPAAGSTGTETRDPNSEPELRDPNLSAEIEAPEVDREEIRQLARQFAEAELRPHVERWDHDGTFDPAVLEQLGELGFFGMLVPDAHGGLGFDLRTYVAALEALAWGEPSVALTLSIHSAFAVDLLVRHGTDQQKARWLPELAAGSRVGCFALSEADAGSDAAAVATTAEREGERWVLRGEKKWVTNGRIAGLAVVIARTAGEGAKGLSAFIVPTETAGWVVERREKTMGLRPIEVVTVRLDGIRLPGDALLGTEGAGFRLAMEGLDLGRLGIAAQAVGIGQAALDHALGYAAERQQFGEPIRQFEAIQFMLADMATGVAAARSLLERSAEERSTRMSSMAKLFASEMAMRVATDAVQVYGGYGYMRDYPVEKLMRDAKATEIYEGTNEIQRVVIARELYRD
ncbi:MAG TPA: acyl-CoA dehydrogenase family protein [Longimicrobiales bacterium]|nr:acyl-CoA dehydrogenase family protein [Longimicrobiales bacterium]